MAVFLLRDETGEAGSRDLFTAIPELREVSSVEEVFKQTSGQHSDPPIILIAASAQGVEHFDRLIDAAENLQNRAFFILISDEISASDYKRLLRTGAADWASRRTATREVVDIIRRRQSGMTGRNGIGLARPQPVTVGFVPSAGGVGNTTLIVETAVLLKTDKATQHRQVCIIDLDFQTSHVCDHLDGEARLQIAEFCGAPERLDEHLLESYKTRHASGVDVFAAPRSKFRSDEMDVVALDALFSIIARRYDLILVDFPVTWFNWTTQVVSACEAIVITGINTIPNLRQLAETLGIVRASAPAGKAAIALNRSEKNLFGLVAGRKQAERVLPDEELIFVSNHAAAVESANMGVPLVLSHPSRKLREEFGQLAKFCASLKSARVASS